MQFLISSIQGQGIEKLEFVVQGFSRHNPNLRTIDFLASGGAVYKYANYAKITCHNRFNMGPSIYYVPLFRGVRVSK